MLVHSLRRTPGETRLDVGFEAAGCEFYSVTFLSLFGRSGGSARLALVLRQEPVVDLESAAPYFLLRNALWLIHSAGIPEIKVVK